MKLVPAWTTRPRSRPRGWFVGVGFLFSMLALMRGSVVKAFIDAHTWVLWGPILIAWRVGYQAYAHPNPLPVILQDVRALFTPRVIVGLVVGGVLFFFADPIKSALDSVLPTDVRGLAGMLLWVFIVLSLLGWEVESEARKTREDLKDIRDKLLDLTLVLESTRGGRRPL